MLVLGAGGPELSGTVTLSDASDLEEETNVEGGEETRWAARRAAVGRLRHGNSKREAALGLAWGAQSLHRTCGYNRAGWREIPSKGWVGQKCTSEDFILSLAEAPGACSESDGLQTQGAPSPEVPGVRAQRQSSLGRKAFISVLTAGEASPYRSAWSSVPSYITYQAAGGLGVLTPRGVQLS